MIQFVKGHSPVQALYPIKRVIKYNEQRTNIYVIRETNSKRIYIENGRLPGVGVAEEGKTKHRVRKMIEEYLLFWPTM